MPIEPIADLLAGTPRSQPPDDAQVTTAVYNHVCGFFWGTSGRAEVLEAFLRTVGGEELREAVFIACDDGPEGLDPGSESPLVRLGAGAERIVMMPSRSSGGRRGASRGYQDGKDCLSAETHLAMARDGSLDGCAGDGGLPVHKRCALCLHDLQRISGRGLMQLLGSHSRFAAGARMVLRPPEGSAVDAATAGFVDLLSSILLQVRERDRLADLAAGILAALTGATLSAVGIRSDGEMLITGEEHGSSLSSARRRELCRFLRSDEAARHPAVTEIWARGAQPAGHAVVVHDGTSLPAGAKGAIRAVATVVGGCLERLACLDDARALAEERRRLEVRFEAEAATRGLLAGMAARLADLDVDGLVNDVGAALGTAAALVSPRGAVLAGSPEVAASPDALRALRRPGTRSARGGESPTVVPLNNTEGAVVAYLCLAGPVTGVHHESWAVMADLLSAAAATQIEIRDATLGSEAAFVLAVLFASGDFPEEELDRWARHLGIDLSARNRVAFLVVARGRSGRRTAEGEQSLRILLRNEFRQARAWLAGGHDGLFCFCSPVEEWSTDDWVAAWERLLPAARLAGIEGVALGGGFPGLSGIRRSYQQAYSLARLQGVAGRVLTVPDVAAYEQAGLAGIVLGHPDSATLHAYVHRVLGPLLEDGRFGGELADTLQAYLATGGSPAQAAELLHLHPSSVKYRMRIIRELIGGEQLEDHDHRFELELALRVLRTLQGIDGGPASRTEEAAACR